MSDSRFAVEDCRCQVLIKCLVKAATGFAAVRMTEKLLGEDRLAALKDVLLSKPLATLRGE